MENNNMMNEQPTTEVVNQQPVAQQVAPVAPVPPTAPVPPVAPAAPVEPTPVVEEKPKKGKTGLIIVILIVLIGLGVGVWYFLGNNKVNESGSDNKTTTTTTKAGEKQEDKSNLEEFKQFNKLTKVDTSGYKETFEVYVGEDFSTSANGGEKITIPTKTNKAELFKEPFDMLEDDTNYVPYKDETIKIYDRKNNAVYDTGVNPTEYVLSGFEYVFSDEDDEDYDYNAVRDLKGLIFVKNTSTVSKDIKEIDHERYFFDGKTGKMYGPYVYVHPSEKENNIITTKYNSNKESFTVTYVDTNTNKKYVIDNAGDIYNGSLGNDEDGYEEGDNYDSMHFEEFESFFTYLNIGEKTSVFSVYSFETMKKVDSIEAEDWLERDQAVSVYKDKAYVSKDGKVIAYNTKGEVLGSKEVKGAKIDKVYFAYIENGKVYVDKNENVATGKYAPIDIGVTVKDGYELYYIMDDMYESGSIGVTVVTKNLTNKMKKQCDMDDPIAYGTSYNYDLNTKELEEDIYCDYEGDE